MRLSTLLHSIYPLTLAADCEVMGLAQNSREVQPGYLFLACRGRTFDGRLYIDEALAKGAAAVLIEADADNEGIEWRQKIPIVKVPMLSAHLYSLAAHFFNYPAQQLQIIGATGTNGKTSCSHFVAQALQKLQHPCGIIGTLGSGFPGALKETRMTTPDAVNLQKIFSELLVEKAQYAAMEVSSHSLDQGRVQGLAFAVGIFTNLTQDHLDYHGNMMAYGAAKKQFFTDYAMQYAVINADDVMGRELIASLAKERVVAYSVQERVEAVPSVFVKNVSFHLLGIHADVSTPWGEAVLQVPLIGEFNLHNVLAVLTTLGVLGFPLNDIVSALEALEPVPGRMQVFGGGGKKPFVIVDYAHTPDALEKALCALRKHCQGRLYCLMGCGGDRDKSKRPLMGACAEQYADCVMITNDNPRHENPKIIIEEILNGFKKPQRALVEPNRFKAIQDIIQYAASGDYVLIAGKGAENYQQIGDERLPFSDTLRVLEVLAEAKDGY